MFTFSPEVAAFLTFVLTNGVKAIFALFGKEVQGFGSAVVAAFVGAILFFSAGVIGGLDPSVQAVVVKVLDLLLIVVGSFGVHYSIKSAALTFANGN